MNDSGQSDWKEHGIRIVHPDELDMNTPQTAGMTRAAAITHARAGARKLWAGTVVVQPAAKTGPHHHGELETVLYIVRGGQDSVGEIVWNMLGRPGRGTSSMCRRLCLTRSSMQLRTKRWRPLWFAADRNRLSSTLILKVPSRLRQIRNRMISTRLAKAIVHPTAP